MIQIGTKVYSGLYGGRDGVVYAIHGEQRPETVGHMGGLISYGGNAEFDIVFDGGTESKKLPESILHGVQWKVYDEIASAEQIQKMREFAASETARRLAEAEAKAKKFSADIAALRSDPHYKKLQQTGQGQSVYSGKLAAINIRQELKVAFKGAKFSVRVNHYTEVRIGWTDGPTQGEVSKIVDKYSGGYFDGMNDIYEHRETPWTAVFGSAQYVNTSRSHSVEALTQAVEAVSKSHDCPIVAVETSYDGSGFCRTTDHHHDSAIRDFLERRHPFEEAAAA